MAERKVSGPAPTRLRLLARSLYVGVGELLRNHDAEGRIFGRIVKLGKPASDGWVLVYVNQHDTYEDPAEGAAFNEGYNAGYARLPRREDHPLPNAYAKGYWTGFDDKVAPRHIF
jgi:hypothetical protein